MKLPKYKERFEIKGYELSLVCSGFPEAYDVFKNGKNVAYIRLRHFCLSLEAGDGYPIFAFDMMGTAVNFNTDNERDYYLHACIEGLDRYLILECSENYKE